MGAVDGFPLDIEGAEEEGIAQWRDRFSWPLSHDRALAVEEEVKGALNEMIEENVAGVGRDLLLTNYKVFFPYSTLINSLRVLKSLNAQGLRPILGGHSQHFRGLLTTGAPLEFLISPPSLPTTTFFRRFKQRLGFRKRLFLSDSSAATLVSGLASRRSAVAFSPNPLALEYLARALRGRARWLDIQSWSVDVERVKLSSGQRGALRFLAEEMPRRAEVIATRSDVILTRAHRRFLFEGTLELLTETLKWFQVVRDRLASRPGARLFVGSSGGQLTRLLSLAMRERGGCVTGFMHGEPLIHDSREYSWLELSTVGRFMTYTDHSAAILRSLSATYPTPGSTSVKIEGVNTKSFRVFRERETRKPRPARIRRVMLVANTFEPVEKEGVVSFPELMQLDWELRILEALGKAGFKPVYKKHPDGKLRGREVHFIDGVHVVYDRFENVMDEADAFVFYHTSTTTLGPALCTNKPVVYIDAGWEKWIPQVRQTFSKRCHIVPAFFDNRNRLLFDPEALSDALKPSERDQNEEILRYMI